AYDRAQPIFERLAADYPNDPVARENLANIHHARANLFLTAKDHVQAERSCRKALEVIERLIKDFPEHPRAVWRLGNIHNLLGILRKRPQAPAEATLAYG